MFNRRCFKRKRPMLGNDPSKRQRQSAKGSRMRTHLMVAALAITTVTASAASSESFVIVKSVDRANEASVQVMSTEELRTLQDSIEDEARLYLKAMALAREAWTKSETNNRPFPSAAIGRRNVSTMSMPFSTREEAETKCQRLNERISLKAAEEEKKQQARLRSRYPDKGVRKEKEDREKERNALGDQVRALYEQQLNLLQGQAGTAAPAPAAPAPGH